MEERQGTQAVDRARRGASHAALRALLAEVAAAYGPAPPETVTVHWSGFGDEGAVERVSCRFGGRAARWRDDGGPMDVESDEPGFAEGETEAMRERAADLAWRLIEERPDLDGLEQGGGGTLAVTVSVPDGAVSLSAVRTAERFVVPRPGAAHSTAIPRGSAAPVPGTDELDLGPGAARAIQAGVGELRAGLPAGREARIEATFIGAGEELWLDGLEVGAGGASAGPSDAGAAEREAAFAATPLARAMLDVAEGALHDWIRGDGGRVRVCVRAPAGAAGAIVVERRVWLRRHVVERRMEAAFDPQGRPLGAPAPRPAGAGFPRP